MNRIILILFAVLLPCSAQERSGSESAPQSRPAPVPLYRVTFERGEPIVGVSPTPTINMPFECTSDGAAFVNLVFQSSIYSPPVVLVVAILPSGEAHEFRLDQLTDLQDVMQKGYYASESGVAFLVRAAREDKQGEETFVASDGVKHEVSGNLAEHHDYIVIFDRKGNYQRTVQIDDSLAVQRVGVFPSGTFLAFGFDKEDRSPKITMLKDDGTILKLLEISKNDAPTSMFGTADANGKGPDVFIRPVQLVPYGDSIVVVLNKSKFPLLEVSETGVIRAIKPKLPDGIQINLLIPSDENLYALVNDKSDGPVYEVSEKDGGIVRRFQVENSAGDVACVHRGKFVAFSHGEGKLVPLIGTAEAVPDALSVHSRESR